MDVLACPTCQGRMKLLALVKDPASIARHLATAGEATEVPSPGLTAGVSVQIIRGLSINAGSAWLVVNTLKGKDVLDAPPGDKLDSFKRRASRVSFIALGYSFKP